MVTITKFYVEPVVTATIPIDQTIINYLVTTTPEYEYENRADRRKKKKEKSTVKLANL